MSRNKTFTAGQQVEFCPVSCRDTSSIKWRDGIYIRSGQDVARGWYYIKVDAFGTIELIPARRVRSKATASGAAP